MKIWYNRTKRAEGTVREQSLGEPSHGMDGEKNCMSHAQPAEKKKMAVCLYAIWDSLKE
jgi:hypothetical protein